MPEDVHVPDTMPACWARTVATWGDHEFLVTPTGCWTYRQVHELVGACARGLVAEGVNKGTHVGILLPNGPSWIVSALAATWLGAVVVPLSTFSSAEELIHLLRHSDISVLVVADEVAGHRYGEVVAEALAGSDVGKPICDSRLPHLRRVHVVSAESEPAAALEAVMAAGASVDPAVPDGMAASVHGDDDCYLLYTSGSTGQPKGVLHRHRSVATNGWWIGERQGLGPGDRAFFYYPLFFSAGCINVLVAALSHGVSLIVIPFLDADVAVDLIIRERPTAVHLWPHSLEKLTSHPRWSEVDVTRIRTGTGPVDVWLGRPGESGGGVSMYGLTETCTALTCSWTTDDVEVRTTTSGDVLPGNEVRIIEPESGAIVEGGADGEILVRGRSLMRRYYKVDVEETFDRDGFFATGDRGAFDASGRLIFKGRSTDMIKVGGVNVSPEEVAMAVRTFDGVVDVHVFGLDDPVLGEVVGAAIVTRDGQPVPNWADQLAKLPSFRRPAAVLWLREDELPQTVTGKVLVRGLREQLADQRRHPPPGPGWAC